MNQKQTITTSPSSALIISNDHFARETISVLLCNHGIAKIFTACNRHYRKPIFC
ncbi:hypothetical protein CCP3SC15_720001 [Gammaproteobacteria bacterium]